MKHLLLMVCVQWACCGPALAADPAAPSKAVATKAPNKAPPGPKPTLANVAYGDDPKQVLDFWKVEAPKPTPLLFFIHGGGWVAGDKSRVAGLEKYLDAGISVVSVEYRFVTQAQAAGVKPPVK